MAEVNYIIQNYLPSEDVCIMYIGANTGQELKYFFSHFKSGVIYCFEPLERTISVLKETINKIREKDPNPNLNIEIINKAVCDIDGDITIWHDPEQPTHQSATIMPLPRPGDKSTHHIDKMLIRGIKLDTFVKERNINKIDLIYADVEGAQGRLLDGATDTLEFTEYLYLETDALWGGPELSVIQKKLEGKFYVILKLGSDTFFKKWQPWMSQEIFPF